MRNQLLDKLPIVKVEDLHRKVAMYRLPDGVGFALLQNFCRAQSKHKCMRHY